MRKLKIAIFTPYNIFKAGGVHEHVTEQARILRKRGHNVTILTPRPVGEGLTDADAPKGVVFLGGSRRIKAPHATSADVSISLDNEAIDAELAKGYDILHVHEPLVPIAARQLLARAEGQALRVGTFHAALPGNMLGKSLVAGYKTYARSVLPMVDAISAVTPAAIGYIEQFAKMPITYIPNGVNLKNYRIKRTQRDPATVLYINRLEKRKGPLHVIKAFHYLKTELRPDAKLIMCSDGPMRSSLEQYVRDYQIEDVEFRGHITEEEKLDLLATATVTTYPSLYGESFGIVLVEAMATGTPIVAHPNDGYVWVLTETGRVGLVNCKDEKAYAHRLQLMMEDQDIRKVWQKWAKDHVKQYDYETIVDAYEKLYRKHMFAKKSKKN